MSRTGRWVKTGAREAYLRAYSELEHLWPVPSVQADVPTSFGTTHVRSSGPLRPGAPGGRIPLVLLHGFPGCGLNWHGVVERLAADRTVHAPDTIGAAGRSEQTAPIRGEQDLARWFTELLDGLGVRRVHLLGESMGAWHATIMARLAPQRLASVTLIEPNGVLARVPFRSLATMLRLGARPTDAGWQAMGEWLTPGVRLTEQEMAVARASLGYRTALGWARTLRDDEVRSIGTPLLTILGGDSVLSRPERTARRLAGLLPDAEIAVYPGRGHGVGGEIPDEVFGRAMEFARRHDGHGDR